MESILEINSHNYREEVIVKSATKIVVVDFFATWCGPCQLIKPILEKLAPEYDFILAKIDIDREPELAAQFAVEGVPDIRIVRNGEMFSGFVGALSEEGIRELLESFNLKSTLTEELENLRKAKLVEDFPLVKQIIDRLFKAYPQRPEVAIEAAKFLIAVNQIEMAEKMLATVNPEDTTFYRRAEAIGSTINWHNELQSLGAPELDRIFARGIRATIREDYATALASFLEVVSNSRKYRDDGGRKAMLTIFNILGDRDPLTAEYQQKLLKILY
jgi:putative thioredoxin